MAARTVLVVDDHTLIRTTLVMALRSQGFDAFHVPVARTADILTDISGYEPGLALLDLYLGEGVESGAELVVPLVSMGWSVLIVTGSRDRYALARAVALGAAGWVSKTESFERLLAVTVDAAAGREVLSQAARSELVTLYRRLRARHDEIEKRLARLSTRERQVLDRLAAGVQAAAVAEEFGISLATVRAQIRSVLTKLDVGTQLAAVALVNEARTPS
ncbi:response regulator [Lentzea nigeriaca]|uniref:response regulator n=1 Tax=Lentzea nigeriaca TaxID=1128665 RepID=UPI00195A1DA0|nr:response regulator [Lentzea nigeriaca]MBM7857222.1 DNA-binding NarL/FixJ family response regulator [Lentzea nigeriaca]